MLTWTEYVAGLMAFLASVSLIISWSSWESYRACRDILRDIDAGEHRFYPGEDEAWARDDYCERAAGRLGAMLFFLAIAAAFTLAAITIGIQ